VLSRFAPSPTGHLHLGHLVNAIYVWHWARRLGGRVRLRIEDHDRERSRPEYEASILDDLEWLGLRPDEPPIAAFRAGPCGGRQSDHPERYASALARLDQDGQVYGCDCSRAALLARCPHAAGRDGDEVPYDGHCRTRGLRPGPGIGTRVRMDEGVETFTDGLMGAQAQAPAAQCGDLLVRDRLGQWTYQFAVTVDDLLEDITHVIRGRDLLASTGRQIRVARMLGRAEPATFVHHPLVLGEDGQKLSKSKNDTGVRELRAAGLSPADVLGRAAAAGRLIDGVRPLTIGEVVNLRRAPEARRPRPEA
jgi:glutamyl/glutaminyl-tRNA synthetase